MKHTTGHQDPLLANYLFTLVDLFTDQPWCCCLVVTNHGRASSGYMLVFCSTNIPHNWQDFGQTHFCHSGTHIER